MSLAARHLLPTLTAIIVFATTAHTQSVPAWPYVFGGWSLQVREGTALNGVTFGRGVPAIFPPLGAAEEVAAQFRFR